MNRIETVANNLTVSMEALDQCAWELIECLIIAKKVTKDEGLRIHQMWIARSRELRQDYLLAIGRLNTLEETCSTNEPSAPSADDGQSAEQPGEPPA
jgi:hypothetical protein